MRGATGKRFFLLVYSVKAVLESAAFLLFLIRLLNRFDVRYIFMKKV
jgi:hypothetical protein